MKLNPTHVAAAILVATAVPASAQNAADNYAAQQPDQDNDDAGKWGLVGLLGLAGLLGLKRRDRDDHHRSTSGTTNRP
jgi:hypothetical protein